LRRALFYERQNFFWLHVQPQNSAPGQCATCFYSATRAPGRW
jgi:hypothetical protein